MGARTRRKPLLQLMRGKVQGKAEETEMKVKIMQLKLGLPERIHLT